MKASSDARLRQLEREAEQARIELSRNLAEVRRRLDPDRLKQNAEVITRQYIERARQKGSQVLQESRQLKDKVVETAMNNPAPTLALGTLVGWLLWRRLRQIPPPILLVCAGGIAGLISRGDGTGERNRRAQRDRYLVRHDSYSVHSGRYDHAEARQPVPARDWSGVESSVRDVARGGGSDA